MNIGIAEKLASALQTLLANEYSNVAHSNDELHDASDALDEFHREALAEYDSAKDSPAGEQWISVDDKLPDELGFYICAMNGVSTVLHFSKGYWTGGITRDCKHPTHWQPFPQPPTAAPEAQDK